MKKILGILSACFLILFTSVDSTFASENSLEGVMQEDYKEMMNAVKKEVLNGASEEIIEGLPEVQQFKNKYSEEQILNFVQTTAVNEAVSRGEINTEISSLDGEREKIIEYDDGSFAILKATTYKENANGELTIIEPESDITPLGTTEIDTLYYSGKPGEKFVNDCYLESWGMWKVAELHLLTKYTVNLNEVKINDTDSGGSKAIAPSSLDVIGTDIVSNNALEVESKGNYKVKTGVTIDGLPLGTVRYVTLNTIIHIHADSGDKVWFWVKDTLTE